MGRSIVGATHLIANLRHKKRSPTKRMPCYVERNNRLRELGMTYRQYLKTDEWRGIRSSVLAISPLCLLCGSKANQVHHADYDWDTLLGVDKRGLISVCDNCHKDIEFSGKRKRTLYEANRYMQTRIRTSDFPPAWVWVKAFAKKMNEYINKYWKEQKRAKRREQNHRRGKLC